MVAGAENEELQTVEDLPKNFNDIKLAKLNGEGVLKYIMIHIKDTQSMNEKTIIRAYGNHVDDSDCLFTFINQELDEVPDNIKNKFWLINSLGGGTLIFSNKIGKKI